MKSKLFMLLVCFSVGFAYADNKINPDKQNVTCGSYKLSSKTSASDVIKYCHVKEMKEENHILHKEQEIKFDAVTIVTMKCEFSKGKLDKCKLDD